MIARVKAGAPLVEHHRDDADAGKRRALIHGRRVKCARLHSDVVAERIRRRRLGGRRKRQAGPGALLPRCVLAHLNLPPTRRASARSVPRRIGVHGGYGSRTDRSSRRLQFAGGSGSSAVADRGRIVILVGYSSRTDRSSRRLRLADGSGSSSVAARGRIGILVGCGSRTDRDPRRLRIADGSASATVTDRGRIGVRDGYGSSAEQRLIACLPDAAW